MMVIETPSATGPMRIASQATDLMARVKSKEDEEIQGREAGGGKTGPRDMAEMTEVGEAKGGVLEAAVARMIGAEVVAAEEAFAVVAEVDIVDVVDVSLGSKRLIRRRRPIL